MNQVLNNENKAVEMEKGRRGKMTEWQSRFIVWRFYQMQAMKEALTNNKGLGIVEIALIIVVIVALAFLFKDKIVVMLNNILDSADTKGLGEKIPVK